MWQAVLVFVPGGRPIPYRWVVLDGGEEEA